MSRKVRGEEKQRVVCGQRHVRIIRAVSAPNTTCERKSFNQHKPTVHTATNQRGLKWNHDGAGLQFLVSCQQIYRRFCGENAFCATGEYFTAILWVATGDWNSDKHKFWGFTLRERSACTTFTKRFLCFGKEKRHLSQTLSNIFNF